MAPNKRLLFYPQNFDNGTQYGIIVRRPKIAYKYFEMKAIALPKYQKGNFMSSSTKIYFVIANLAGVMLMVSAGCESAAGRRTKQVDLYLDAVMLTELNQKELAIEKLNEAVTADNRFLPAFSMLGQIYADSNDYEKSAAAYEKATQLNKWSFKDHFNLGRVYQNMKEFGKAAIAYARACEIDAKHLDAHINAAKCFLEVKDYDRALTFSQLAEQIDPNAARVQMLLADIYQARNDYEGLTQSLERALKTDANNPKIMTTLVDAYLKTRRYKPAKDLLLSLAQIEPDNGTVYQNLGYCYLKLNDADGAIDSYSEAININARDWQARKGLGTAYILKANEEDNPQLRLKAVQQWKMSLAINPDQPNWGTLLKLIEKYSKQE
jgi:tetratricopeptide (TPR) repeat protein